MDLIVSHNGYSDWKRKVLEDQEEHHQEEQATSITQKNY